MAQVRKMGPPLDRDSMTYFADLTPYSYSDDVYGPWQELLNVGWLEPGRPLPTGPVPEPFVAKLARLCKDPVAVMRGFHVCAIPPCTPRGWPPLEVTVDGEQVMLGHAEVRVGSGTCTWFAAPTLVYHYVTVHDYQPPEAFIQAVLGSDRARTE